MDFACEEGIAQTDKFPFGGSCGADTPTTVSTCLGRRSATDLEDRAVAPPPPGWVRSRSRDSCLQGHERNEHACSWSSESSGCLHGDSPEQTWSVRAVKSSALGSFSGRPGTSDAELESLQAVQASEESWKFAQTRSLQFGEHRELELQELGANSERVPMESIGSVLHSEGLCKPCAWYWKPQSCENGRHCLHCHLCSADEPRRRRKQKKEIKRALLRAVHSA